MEKHKTMKKRIDDFMSGSGWLVVISGALSLSWWSLYYVARKLGAPIPAAAIVSLVIDGAAILSAHYALLYARAGDSGFGPRCGVFVFCGFSVYLNSEHSALAHGSTIGRIFYAIAPIAAVTMLEYHTRWERRNVLRHNGRIAPPMPPFGRGALLFPIKTVRLMRAIQRNRLARMSPTVTDYQRIFGGNDETAPDNLTITGDYPSASPDNPAQLPQQGLYALPGGSRGKTNAALIRSWGKEHGYPVGFVGPLPADLVTAFYTARTNTGEITAVNGSSNEIETE